MLKSTLIAGLLVVGAAPAMAGPLDWGEPEPITRGANITFTWGTGKVESALYLDSLALRGEWNPLKWSRRKQLATLAVLAGTGIYLYLQVDDSPSRHEGVVTGEGGGNEPMKPPNGKPEGKPCPPRNPHCG
jgi:hypothetical protein